MQHKWLEWAKRIHSLSQAGLTFSKDIYDIERYQELHKISNEIMAEYTNLNLDKIEDLFANESGYPTPKIDVRGVVFQNNGILMVREKSDDKWALPGGFCEVGLSPSENAIKEIQEESGYSVIPIKLLAVLDMNYHPHPPQPYHYYKIFIQCEICGGQATTGIETKDVHFFQKDNLPQLSTNRNTESQIKMLFEFNENPMKESIFN
ncbi:NUDIX hydrolase [Bacillus cereus]|uniref:NUDIX hydrolase n=1 Tax=Bacillus cereus TaxID=1396 RepID=UPI0018F79447|nr:NUDIX hydrolase [Bacillus cereus]MBJ7935845.1 NUDIX hydrolase [Bacillus cereus]